MRLMTDEERALLDRLLAPDFDGADKLREQVNAITAVETSCTCGCPSFAPEIDRSRAAPVAGLRSPLPVELVELDRADGVPRTVLVFADEGYIADVECVYYDDAKPEWPVLANSVVMVHDENRYLVSVVLPSGRIVRPQEENDRWVGTTFTETGFTGTTWTGFKETFDLEGDLTERVFTK